MENEVRERLKLYLRGIQGPNLANKLGYKPATLSSKISGARGIDLGFLCVVLKHFPQLSAEWLLRGTEPMERTDNESDQELKAICIEQTREIYRLRQRLDELEASKKGRA